MVVDMKNENVNGRTEQTTTGLLSEVMARGREVMDGIIPPAQRAKWQGAIKQFAANNPKLTAFLLVNLVLSGGPLLLFSIFVTTVLIVSISSAIVMALIAAMLFTAFMVVIALCVLMPTIFLTTIAATFIFGWALAGYYVLKWITESKNASEVGLAVEEKIDALSGGRLSSAMDRSTAPAVEGKAEVQREAQKVDTKDHANGLTTTATNDSSVAKDYANSNGITKSAFPDTPKDDTPLRLSSPQPIRLTA